VREVKADLEPRDDTTERRIVAGSGAPNAEERAKRDSLLHRVIADRYEVTGTIGSGGMGTVYAATQRGLNRKVAVKVLKKDLLLDPETVARFHREAHAMSLLMHPNSVRVFEFGETEDGRLFIAMELLQGKLLTRTSFMDEDDDIARAVRVAKQILGSLAEAHSKGIIHRDLKPDNIFLAEVEGQAEPVVKVLDFGIAKVFAGDPKLDQLETQQGTVFGTPRYMSPEQAQGKQLDWRSDLYSVGSLLYEMVAGRAPFSDPDAIVVMAKHIREAPQTLRDAIPTREVPQELDDVVMRALEKDPAKRYQTAEEFIDALDAAVPEADMLSRRRKRLSSSGAIPVPREFASPDHTVLPTRRTVPKWLPALLLGVALLGGGLWAWLSRSGEEVSAEAPAADAPASPPAQVVSPAPPMAPTAEPVAAAAPSEAVPSAAAETTKAVRRPRAIRRSAPTNKARSPERTSDRYEKFE
jgi:serine/threonine protein kinase